MVIHVSTATGELNITWQLHVPNCSYGSQIPSHDNTIGVDEAYLQYVLSTDTIGTKIFVLISEVSLFQGESIMYLYEVGTGLIVVINQGYIKVNASSVLLNLFWQRPCLYINPKN